jgi:hypothetical protein
MRSTSVQQERQPPRDQAVRADSSPATADHSAPTGTAAPTVPAQDRSRSRHDQAAQDELGFDQRDKPQPDQPVHDEPQPDQPVHHEPQPDQPVHDEPTDNQRPHHEPTDNQRPHEQPPEPGSELFEDVELPWWLLEEFCGTEEAEQASWLAGLPEDVREEYERGPYTGEGEAIPPGFSHHDEGGGQGCGFAAGGANDTALPGPALASALQAAAGVPLTGGGRHGELGESELIGVLCGWRRLTSWAQAGEAAAAHALVRRRADQARDPRKRYLREHCGDEVAAALRLSGGQADRLLEIAAGLARIPEVHAALEAGLIDYARACAFIDLLAGLDDETAREIARTLLGGGSAGAGGQTSGKLRRRLEREVLDADPDAAKRRQEEGRLLTRVDTWREGSGNAVLAGRELRPADVIAIDKQLTSMAEWLQSNGASGTVRELRSQVFTALLSGRELSTLLPDDNLPPEPRPTAEPDGVSPEASKKGADKRTGRHGARDGHSETGEHGATGCATGGKGVGSEGRAESRSAGEGYPDTSQAGEGGAGDSNPRDTRDSNPGDTGEGNLRDTRDSNPRDTGDGNPGTSHSGADSSGWLRLAGTVNLTMPFDTWAGLAQRAGEVAGYGVTDASTCSSLAHLMGQAARWCLTVTDKTGRPVAHACARTAPPAGETAIRWASDLRGKLEYLADGVCSHARRSAGHDPPNLLRHLVMIRQRTCAFPGCSRAASRCDLDHTRAYRKGGMTCECNLAPLCRKHHQAKQTPGWLLEQPRPGHLTWHLPHQRSYQTAGDPYPV